MIDLHYWTTPNGHKVTMFLEESALPYRIVPVNISKGDQFKPEFLAISPNNRIPAIVDHSPKDGGKPISVFESGAILLYLAEKTGRFLPSELRRKVGVIQWLFWQMGGLGPMAGQKSPLQPVRARKASLRYRSLRQGDEPSLWRAQQTTRGPCVRDGRVLDRGHGRLPMGRSLETSGTKPRRVPPPQALVRDDSGAARHRARL